MGIRAQISTSKAPPGYSLLPYFKYNKKTKMTMWADNVKFVKDILDSKYQKIDSAVLEFTESSEALQKDVNCNKSKEHFLTAIRTLELMQTTEIEMLLETIISEMHAKEKKTGSSIFHFLQQSYLLRSLFVALYIPYLTACYILYYFPH